ncbi:diadenylate cyclase-like [Rattus rattus]|uniref:diadenylate cyclase-like n=1 Tax=Rattus rattus TaxID=10117 RepID=UPI0013F2C5D8|nr:diadenylate cyclase-like [Rattus rattus]
MSKHKVGALIVVEKEMSLDNYISLGYNLQAKLTAELLIAIFSNKHSSLHDGGIVVRKLDIVSLSSYFPITQTKLTTNLGARHRAAAGLTESTDSVAFVVSETNGHISYSVQGKIIEMDHENQESLMDKIFELLHFYID